MWGCVSVNIWPGFRYVDSCIDYQTVVTPLDTSLTQVSYDILVKKLLLLGVADRERMGVTYVRGPWGFLVIPGRGFPELRISFFHDASEQEVNTVLVSIGKAIEESYRSLLPRGGENE